MNDCSGRGAMSDSSDEGFRVQFPSTGPKRARDVSTLVVQGGQPVAASSQTKGQPETDEG